LIMIEGILGRSARPLPSWKRHPPAVPRRNQNRDESGATPPARPRRAAGFPSAMA
jgi:hypothetical protein